MFGRFFRSPTGLTPESRLSVQIVLSEECEANWECSVWLNGCVTHGKRTEAIKELEIPLSTLLPSNRLEIAFRALDANASSTVRTFEYGKDLLKSVALCIE